MVARHQLDIPMVQLTDLCQRFHVRELALFGSVLRDDFRDDSDIDVLVEYEPDATIGLFEHFHLNEELELLLRRKVDLVSKGGLNPLLSDAVLRSAATIFPETGKACTPTPHVFRREEFLLRRIVDLADELAELVSTENRESFLGERLTHRAAAMSIIQSGNVASRMPESIRDADTRIDWDQWAAYGERLMTRYYDVDWIEVWEHVAVAVPALRRKASLALDAQFSSPKSG